MKISTGLILTSAVTGFAALIMKAVEYTDNENVVSETVEKQEETEE